MADKIYLNGRFGFREDTLKNWETNNPILEKGEPSIVRDGSDGRWLKIGDGVSRWNELPYKLGPEGPVGGSRLFAEDGTSVIFNDYENNVAGTKGFSILSGDEATRSYVLDSTVGLESFGDWSEEERYLSFHVTSPSDSSLSHRSDRHSRIVAVNPETNTITVDVYYDYAPDGGIGEGSYVRVIAHPELGTRFVEGCAFAAGYNNRALGEGSFTAGANQIANGAYSFLGGKNNFANYCGTAFGRYNWLFAQLCTALGQYNQLYGHNSAAIGNMLRTIAHNQLAVGRFNAPDERDMFEVGAGDSEDTRRNAFAVRKNGDIAAPGEVFSGGKSLNGEIELLKNMPIAQRVEELPDIGNADRLYFLLQGAVYDIYAFLVRSQGDPAVYWDGSIADSYAGGSGSEADPYLIATAEQLARAVNNGGENGGYFKLLNSIYLNDITAEDWAASGSNRAWFTGAAQEYYIKASDGTDTAETVVFSGHIDGGGYTIYGLWYADDEAVNPSHLSSLIPAAKDGTEVRNLGISNAQIVAFKDVNDGNSGGTVRGQAAGFIADTAKKSAITIENCCVDEDVRIYGGQSGCAAGLLGYARQNDNAVVISLTNCCNLMPAENFRGQVIKKNGLIGEVWKTYFAVESCYSVVKPYDGTSSAVTNRPQGSFVNVYSAAESSYSNDLYTLLEAEQMQGYDSLQTMALGDAFAATEGYPLLKALTGEWERVNPVVDQTYDPASENPQSGIAVAEAISLTEKDLTALIEERISKAIAEKDAESGLAAHPVGSLYWSSDSTEPSELFGGSWERVKDKFILAAGDSYAAGAVGGEAEHTLTVDEMPAHKHKSRFKNAWTASGTGGGNWFDSSAYYWGKDEEYAEIETALSVGGGEAHNNMPPYEVYYCWKRVA